MSIVDLKRGSEMERVLAVLERKTIADGLTKISEMNLSALRQAAEQYSAGKRNDSHENLTALGLRNFVSQYVDSKSAATFVSHLMGMERTLDKFDVSNDDLLIVLKTFYEKKGIETGDQVVNIVKFFISESDLFIVYKASRLYYDVDERASDIDILTESRPIFDREADRIVGFIIRSVLTIHGEEDSQGRSDYALSMRDLDSLIEQAQRAKKKAKVLRDQLVKDYPDKIAIFGAAYNDR